MVTRERVMKEVTLTCGEQHDGLHAGVLCGVHVEHLELLDLLLEYSNVVHEGDHSISSHGGGVKSCCCQQRGYL